MASNAETGSPEFWQNVWMSHCTPVILLEHVLRNSGKPSQGIAWAAQQNLVFALQTAQHHSSSMRMFRLLRMHDDYLGSPVHVHEKGCWLVHYVCRDRNRMHINEKLALT